VAEAADALLEAMGQSEQGDDRRHFMERVQIVAAT
jgi:hypothetical protein